MPRFRFHVSGFRTKGFTLIELLVSSAISIIIAVVVVVNLYGWRDKSGYLDNTTKQIAALLREAQARSVSQASGMSWGVHFESNTGAPPFYALFGGPVYTTSSRTGYYRLPAQLVYVTSTFAGGTVKEVTFAQLTGLASASTSLNLYIVGNPALSSTIQVASSGAVSF